MASTGGDAGDVTSCGVEREARVWTRTHLAQVGATVGRCVTPASWNAHIGHTAHHVDEHPEINRLIYLFKLP